MNGKLRIFAQDVAAAVLMFGFIASADAAAAPAAAPIAAPAAPASAGLRILMIDRNLIMQRSLAGRDITAQVQSLLKQAETQFGGEETQLQTEATQLQQQLAILAPDVRDQKEKDFTAKERSLQTRAQQRQADIQAAFGKATQQLEAALEPILIDMMRERGAAMVLDRAAVIISGSDMDVSQAAVQQLDKKLPHVKVDLVAGAGTVPSAGAAPARPAAPAKPAGAGK